MNVTSAPTFRPVQQRAARPTPEQLDSFRKREREADEDWRGTRLGRGMLIGGLTMAGLGGSFAAISNPALGLTVPGAAIICGCLGAGIGGGLALLAR